MDFELRHGRHSRGFTCIFACWKHPNSATFEFNRFGQHKRLMPLDILDLRSFYERPLGGIVRRVLTRRVRARWRNVQGLQLMGLGFAAPYVGQFRDEAGRLGALMPANQGALAWPASGRLQTVMVEAALLPLQDASVDRFLVIHCLEASEGAGPLLREIWRVLAPEGRLLLIVPNRRGVWAQLDTTPFGQGLPYSRGQLERLLTDAMFTPLEWTAALYMPPIDRRWLVRWATVFERIGARLWPGLAGVIIVEARKELVGAMPASVSPQRQPKLASVPGLSKDCV
jgi:SAM-dependent methyltransferase